MDSRLDRAEAAADQLGGWCALVHEPKDGWKRRLAGLQRAILRLSKPPPPDALQVVCDVAATAKRITPSSCGTHVGQKRFSGRLVDMLEPNLGGEVNGR